MRSSHRHTSSAVVWEPPLPGRMRSSPTVSMMPRTLGDAPRGRVASRSTAAVCASFGEDVTLKRRSPRYGSCVRRTDTRHRQSFGNRPYRVHAFVAPARVIGSRLGTDPTRRMRSWPTVSMMPRTLGDAPRGRVASRSTAAVCASFGEGVTLERRSLRYGCMRSSHRHTLSAVVWEPTLPGCMRSSHHRTLSAVVREPTLPGAQPSPHR